MLLRSSLKVALLLLGTAAQLFGQDSTARRLENKVAGISITRPANWRIVSEQTLTENRSRVQMTDTELKEAVQKLAPAPLFAFMKYPDNHPSVNPTIQVAIRPTASISTFTAQDVMKQTVSVIQSAFPDFAFITPIENVDVSGIPAAHMKGRYTLTNDGGMQFKVTARMWIVMRGEALFIIGMSGPQEGADVSDAEFAEVLRSIVIQK